MREDQKKAEQKIEEKRRKQKIQIENEHKNIKST